MNTKHQIALQKAKEKLLSIDRNILLNDLLETEYDEDEQSVDDFFSSISGFDTCQLFNLAKDDEIDEMEADFNLAYSVIPYAIISKKVDCNINFIFENYQKTDSSITIVESRNIACLDLNFLYGMNQKVYCNGFFDDNDSYEPLVA